MRRGWGWNVRQVRMKFGLCLLTAAGSVFGLGDSYKVKPGDTVERIASRLHVKLSALLDKNDLSRNETLRVGRKLLVPGASSSTTTEKSSGHHKRHRSSSSTEHYTVRNGDNDWAIAHRFHIGLRALHQSNPNVDFDALQPGEKIALPESSESTSDSGNSSSSRVVVAEKHHSARGSYRVSEGENDWTIAAKLGITLKELHRDNPDVDWDALHIGAKLHVPGASLASHSSSKRIRTRLAVVNADNVTLRRGPSTDSGKVTTVDAGTIARVLDHEGSWYKLRFPKGTEAWVRADLLNPVKHHREQTYAASSHRRRSRRHSHTPEPVVAMSAIKGNKLLATAFSYRGVRYRTGGTSRGGFDCSGLTSTVYAKNGVHLPRTAHEQASVGKHVGIDQLKKGDLVFFKTNRGVRINHVGMYIGDGKFIHASSGGGRVQVSSLNEGYYRRRFATARRVVKEKPAHKAKEAPEVAAPETGTDSAPETGGDN